MASIVTSPPPRGFTVTTAEDGRLVVRYREAYRWVSLYIVVVWIAGSIFATHEVVSGRSEETWGLLGVWLITLILSLIGIQFMLLTTTLVFEPDWLTIQQRILRSRRTTIRRSDVRGVVQRSKVDDEGFPQWHLVIDFDPPGGRDRIAFLKSSGGDDSEWLGQVVARWAGVPFVPASDQP